MALCFALHFAVPSPGLAPLRKNADHVVYDVQSIQDGPLSEQLHLPLYEWLPKGVAPTGAVLAVHGLALHASLYDVVGKAFAAAGFYCCAPDLRGFGRCFYDSNHKFSVNGDSKQKVDLEKSYQDLVDLAKATKARYPDVPLFLMGESLGTSFCIRLAAEHPELFYGLILSSPTVVVHPLMFLHPGNVVAGTSALLFDPKFRMSTKTFVQHLVSNDPNIVDELSNDPLCRKELTIRDLVHTKKFVSKTLKYAHQLPTDLPILIVQGSEDRCFVPHAVTQLSRRIESSDQTVRWLHAHGHILFETAYLRPSTVDAVEGWLDRHDESREEHARFTQLELQKLGAKME